MNGLDWCLCCASDRSRQSSSDLLLRNKSDHDIIAGLPFYLYLVLIRKLWELCRTFQQKASSIEGRASRAAFACLCFDFAEMRLDFEAPMGRIWMPKTIGPKQLQQCACATIYEFHLGQAPPESRVKSDDFYFWKWLLHFQLVFIMTQKWPLLMCIVSGKS